MKNLFAFLFVALLFVGVQDVWAQGDVGSAECGAAQEACLDAISMPPPGGFKSHGEEVSACARASNAEAGFAITDECHSCIVNPVARRIPKGDQQKCGSDDPCADCPCDFNNVPFECYANIGEVVRWYSMCHDICQLVAFSGPPDLPQLAH